MMCVLAVYAKSVVQNSTMAWPVFMCVLAVYARLVVGKFGNGLVGNDVRAARSCTKRDKAQPVPNLCSHRVRCGVEV